MNLPTVKSGLIKLIRQTSDVVLLGKIRQLFDEYEWQNLPVYVKEGILRGQEQALRGEEIPHEEVMKKYNNYL